LCGFWSSSRTEQHEEASDRRSDMHSYLDGRINSFTITIGVHVASLFADRAGRPEFHHNKKIYWRDFLIRNGIAEELRDPEQIALFMFRCGRPEKKTLSSLRMLLELGMDPNTVDRTKSFEHNALHRVLFGEHIKGDPKVALRSVSDSERKTLEEKLVALIEAGTKIHHCDCYGFTPSLYARAFDWWHEWCQALGRTGLTIEEVLRVESNEWLQEAGWKQRVATRSRMGATNDST
jgi:hypothetical protein